MTTNALHRQARRRHGVRRRYRAAGRGQPGDVPRPCPAWCGVAVRVMSDDRRDTRRRPTLQETFVGAVLSHQAMLVRCTT
eukprot:5805818-Prymnesium_polylepis.2